MTYLDALSAEAAAEQTPQIPTPSRRLRAGDRLDLGHGPTVRVAMPWVTEGGQQWQRWIDARREGITATDVAAILGMSPYKTPLAVWDEKVNGTVEDLSGRYVVARGNALEAFLADWWARSGDAREVRRAPALLAHPDKPLILASLDRIGVEDGETVVIECKTAGWRQRDDWWDGDRLIPDHYAAQVLTQLWVTGLERAVVVADVAGDDATVTIMRDREWEAAVWPILQAFWRRVTERVPPDQFDPIEDYPALHRAWVPVPKSCREADEFEADLLAAWAAASRAAKRAETEAKELRGQVRAMMRDSQQMTIGGEPAATISGQRLLVGKALKGGDREK